MKIEDKISFSQREHADIKQRLQYIDFLRSRSFSLPTDGDNIIATFMAMSALTGRVFTKNVVQATLSGVGNEGGDARFISCYYKWVESLLQCDADLSVDEWRIKNIYASIYDAVDETLPVVVTPALSEWIEWLLVQFQSEKWHSLLVAGIFLYEFLSLPSADEYREEVMLLLALILLRRCCCEWVLQYTPFRIMAADRVAYRRAIRHIDVTSSNLSQWIVYWIDCIYKSACNTSMKLPAVSSAHKSPVNLRQRRILDFIEAKQPVGIAAIVAHLHKESVNTVKKDLLRLRELGYITTSGVLKGTVYYKA